MGATKAPMRLRVVRPFTRLDMIILTIRAFALCLAVIVFVAPVVRAQLQETQRIVAVDSQRIGELERGQAVLITQNASLNERVSHIEGIGVGLGALTIIQMFLQVMGHVQIQRKGK